MLQLLLWLVGVGLLSLVLEALWEWHSKWRQRRAARRRTAPVRYVR